MSQAIKKILVEQHGVDPNDFDKAKAHASKKRITLLHACEELKVSSTDKLLRAFADAYRIQVADLMTMDIPSNITSLIPDNLARVSRVIPLDRVGNNIIIATGDPQNLKLIDQIRFQTGYTVKPVLASEMAISASLDKYYGIKEMDISVGDESVSIGPSGAKEEGRSEIGADASTEDMGPIIKLVDQILVQCSARGASDVHIEPYERYMRVRFRIDGVLHEITRPPANYRAPMTSRIKIMSNMNIAEKRVPQDGGIRVTLGGKPIDFRVSTLPTIWGEKIVMRILDQSALQVDMTALGFEQDDLDRFKSAIHKPFGMVLVTGPTGSGKTTTLYSALAELNKVSENIMTAEDPVEFNLEGINQVQVNNQVGLDFGAALKSFLRQDPDIIMVGEIRDLTTGEIAMKAALTGHMVLSTLHTNSAADTVVRLQNMGLESFNLISALNAIVAQRLARRICTKCRIADESITPEIIQSMGVHAQYAHKVRAYKGKGCGECGGTGNKGRVAIHEVMSITDELRQAIMRGAPAMELKKIAMSGGMRSLRQNALNKMASGVIDAYEVQKNTSSDTDGDAKLGAA